MWVNTRDRLPEKDGQYIMQTVCGGVSSIRYTVEGGWNTYRNSDGTLVGADNKGSWDLYVVRWFYLPEPKPVPNKWIKEWKKSIEEADNATH